MNTLRLALTLDCNKSCSYCVMKRPEVVSTFIPKKLSDIDFKKYDEVLITGGEPTIHPHFEDIIRYIQYKNSQIRVYLYTNGINILNKNIIFDGVNWGIHDRDWEALSNIDKSLISTYKASHRIFQYEKDFDTVVSIFAKDHKIPYKILFDGECQTHDNEDRFLLEE